MKDLIIRKLAIEDAPAICEISVEGLGYNCDLIGLDVYCNDKHIGHVDSILKTNAHEILVVKNGSKHMIPNIDELILNVDLDNNRLDIKYMKGLLNED